jgi:drug/metabolite transporter (DMT)-like permease
MASDNSAADRLAADTRVQHAQRFPVLVGLFLSVILAWGLNWVVMKVVVREVTPIWAVAFRTWIAAVVLIPTVALSRQLIVPHRSDLPIIGVISLVHMVAFAALMTAGLKFLPVGRAVVLGYTTPLWVAPAAWIFLKEATSPRQIAGIAIGLAGLLLLFDPRTFNWWDQNQVFGNGLILGAAVCWSISIVYTRAHRWVATPFQLVLWQALLAAIVLTVVAVMFEGMPNLSLSAAAVASLVYNGAIGTALGFWAMTVVNKELPAVVTSLGVLGTPVVGLGLSSIILDEGPDFRLFLSSALILFGITIGTISAGRRR